eukprot:TRINITY_DN1999_c0_g2_i13.p1 TRINITY_DN1999_c0_g2~~TRINITY_DN1999_c0_g2_i13.p1  ORF type:complete len:131 (+),score=39.54 TRINITY_DN1999_c0_g2_i13:25-393(+)
MIRRPPRSTQSRSSAASDVYKRQGIYYACKNYTCMESPLVLDVVCSAFMVLSSFWVRKIFSTLGMKLANKGKPTKLVRAYVRGVKKVSRSVPLKVLIHGSVAIVCLVVPLTFKVSKLLKLQA